MWMGQGAGEAHWGKSVQCSSRGTEFSCRQPHHTAHSCLHLQLQGIQVLSPLSTCLHVHIPTQSETILILKSLEKKRWCGPLESFILFCWAQQPYPTVYILVPSHAPQVKLFSFLQPVLASPFPSHSRWEADFGRYGPGAGTAAQWWLGSNDGPEFLGCSFVKFFFQALFLWLRIHGMSVT